MSDPVLTDEEKDALLDGVSSGAVEVQSANGKQYASVAPFVIGRRARIVSNSYPRLQAMNDQLGERLAASTETLLQAAPEVTATAIRGRGFADHVDAASGRCAAVPFTATPLPGAALIVLDIDLVGHLVENFFGGEQSAAGGDTALSPGALAVARLFVGQVLTALREVWQPLKPIVPEAGRMVAGLDLIDAIGDGEEILVSEFELSCGGQRGGFSIVWPCTMIAAQLPALEGKPAERDAAADRLFEKTLRRKLEDVTVGLSSEVGDAAMSLGQLINLAPGDVIDIDSPRSATMHVGGISLLAGRFGVQAGHNAVEATHWLDPDPDNQ